MGTETGRPKADGWRERVMAGADGVLHAASCCSPDAWLTDLRVGDAVDLRDDVPSAGESVSTAARSGRVHVVGTTR